MTSPCIPPNLFMAGCINYKSHIKNRNDLFFLNDKNIKEKVGMFGNFTEDCGLDNYWSQLTDKTKKSIWDYIQSLFVLGEIIINNNPDLFLKYNSLYLSSYKNEIKNLHDNFSLDFLTKINS